MLVSQLVINESQFWLEHDVVRLGQTLEIAV